MTESKLLVFPRGRMVRWLAAGLLLLAFLVQCLTGLVHKSATYDEQVYVAAGYTYLDRGDLRLKPDAPPLVATLAGATLQLAGLMGEPIRFPYASANWEQAKDFAGAREYSLAREFFHGSGNDGRKMLLLARLPIVLLGLVLGVALFLWAQRCFGPAGGLLALLAFCFDPSIVAHAQIVSADIAVAALFFLTHFAWHRLLDRLSRRRLLLFAISFALALHSKYTALLLGITLPLVWAITFVAPTAAGLESFGTRPSYRRHLIRVAWHAGAAAAVATLLVMFALYREWTPWTRYLAGVQQLYANVGTGFTNYLCGEFSPETWPHYYLVAFALKTPESTLLLLVLALLPWRGRPYSRIVWLALVPVVVIHVASSQDAINIGLRRVLLTYPFLFLIIGRLAEAWQSSEAPDGGAAYRPWPAAGLVVLGFLALLTAARIHPHQLSYFNLLCGGPANGPAYLDDSNLDWGQDLPSLRDYMTEEKIEQVTFHSDLAIEDPRVYGIPYRRFTVNDALRPSRRVYAIGASSLVSMKHDARNKNDPRLDWLARFRPTTRVGYSIYVYDFRQP